MLQQTGNYVASFPGSSAPERDIEVLHACTFRVPESLGTRLVIMCKCKPRTTLCLRVSYASLGVLLGVVACVVFGVHFGNRLARVLWEEEKEGP